MPAVAHLTGPTRDNAIELIGRLAGGGVSDPRIADRLGYLTTAEVAALRRENGIDAGEHRWRGQKTPSQGEVDQFAHDFDWCTVSAGCWRAITLMGPWDLPIVAPHAYPPLAAWSYPVPDGRTSLPEPKRCENRRWSTSWRGPLLIHAGKNWDPDGQADPRVQAMWQALRPDRPMTRTAWSWAGHVTGVARLIDCHHARPGCCPGWGAQGPGIRHLILADVRALREPVAARGHQQLWTPTPALVGQVRPLIPRDGGLDK